MELNELFSFYEEERESRGKSKRFMIKIYWNRITQNLNRDRDMVIHIFNSIWELHFKWKASLKRINNLVGEFTALVDENFLWSCISDYLEFRKTEL